MPFENQVSFSIEESNSLTTNLNYLAPVYFRMAVDRLKFPNVEYTVQTVVLPDVTVSQATLASPHRNIPLDGDKVDYGELQISFLIDEDMKNYQEIYDWMIGEVTQADKGGQNKKTRDITLSILSSHNNITREIQFVDAFPTTLSSLPFDLTVTDTQYLTAVVSFSYGYFKLR